MGCAWTDAESCHARHAGVPIVHVVPLDTPEPAQRSRLGFMARQANGPDGFDTLGALTIEDLLQGAPLRSA